MNDIQPLLPPRIHCFIDFDGTISVADTTDLLLEQFAEPEWQTIEAAWERGEFGSRECMSRQVELLRVEPARLDLFASRLRLDDGFVPFVESLQASGIAVTILSDGLDRVIAGALKQIDLPVLANSLRTCGGDRWRLECPHTSENCRAGAAHCKCASLDRTPADMVRVLIGDGRSDFCAASTADMVFAKGRLADHCRETGITHRAFDTFADMPRLFADWLDAVTLQAAPLL
jgi:2,3-diketo-5-methylthio-1-phosphopentane phosphatase